MSSGPWQKSPADLVERFGAALPSHAAVERRPMFGYPCAFVNGNMFCGLFQHRVLARLGAAEAASLIAAGKADPFAPTPGRALKEYVLVPAGETNTVSALSPWLAKALAFGLTVEPRPSKAKSNTSRPPGPQEQGDA